jgi:hypothetical protein
MVSVGLLLSHLLEFALAVASAWKTLMAGAIFFGFSLPNNLLGQGQQDKLDQHVARRAVLRSISVLFVFLACFQAWEGEHQDRRSLTDLQKRNLGTELAKLRAQGTLKSSYLGLAATNGDPESLDYGKDFADAVRRAGMEPRFGFPFPDDPEQVGVMLALRDPKSQPPETEPLRAALQSIGVEPKILGFPRSGISIEGRQDDLPNIVLWIGSRP